MAGLCCVRVAEAERECVGPAGPRASGGKRDEEERKRGPDKPTRVGAATVDPVPAQTASL